MKEGDGKHILLCHQEHTRHTMCCW